MAINQALRYYRGQFNPEQAYQQNNSDNGDIISMYDPQGLDQFIDATSRRQERFDTAKMAQAQEIARIGEMETYDLSELNNRLTSFESNINDLVKTKYNGDYGAAANEIAKQIGTERTNPFYHFNKQKVESVKAYLDAKMKLGANFLSSGNPLDVNFKDWQQGKTFEFTPINREDIVKSAMLVGQNFAKQVTSDSGLQETPEGQYFKNVIQYGLKDEKALDNFIASSGLDEQIINSMPELNGVKDKSVIKDAIRQGLTTAIGTTETKYLGNQNFSSDLDVAKVKATMMGDSGPTNLIMRKGFLNNDNIKDYIPTNNSKGEPIGIMSFKLKDLQPGNMSPQAINTLNKNKEQVVNTVKPLILGEKLNEGTTFADRTSRKNAENMDSTKPFDITDIALSPNSEDLILGVSGTSKEGKRLESQVILDAGRKSVPRPEIWEILNYFASQAAPQSEFSDLLESWVKKFYPKMLE